MKATGMVRKIDELGRIVIPKEIRRTLKIKEGDSLEIYMDEESEIILKKHSFLNVLNDIANKYVDSVYSFMNKNIIITDRDIVIAASSPLKKKYLGNQISNNLEKIIEKRESTTMNDTSEIEFISGSKMDVAYTISPIIANGEVEGLVIIFSDTSIESEDEKIAQLSALFLGKQLED